MLSELQNNLTWNITHGFIVNYAGGENDVKKLLILLTALLVLPSVLYAQPADSPKFRDISDHWARVEIEETYRQGIMQGIDNNTFAPDLSLTRAQLAACLVRAFQLNMDNLRFIKAPSASDLFKDTQDGMWYSEAVMIAGYNNIFDVKDGIFRPAEPVTRIETARAIINAFKARNIQVITTQIWPEYSDIKDLSQDDTNALTKLFNMGIMKGYNQSFFPGSSLTRAETAVVLNRTLNVIKISSTGDNVPTSIIK